MLKGSKTEKNQLAEHFFLDTSPLMLSLMLYFFLPT